jgi:hypothetical protein
MDDRALIYRGADQPDMSVINPESDVWQHIKVRLFGRLNSEVALISSRFHKRISLQTGQLDILPSAMTDG